MSTMHAVVRDIRKLNVGDQVFVDGPQVVARFKKVARVIVGDLDDNPENIVILFEDQTYTTLLGVMDLGTPLETDNPDNPYAKRPTQTRLAFEVAVQLARQEANGWCMSEANTLCSLPEDADMYENRTVGEIMKQVTDRAYARWPRFVEKALELITLVRKNPQV